MIGSMICSLSIVVVRYVFLLRLMPSIIVSMPCGTISRKLCFLLQMQVGSCVMVECEGEEFVHALSPTPFHSTIVDDR